MRFLVHNDVISVMTLSRRHSYFYYVFEIFEYTFLLIGSSNYDGGHFENMTSTGTAGVQYSET